MKITNDYTTRASADFWIGEYWKNVDFELPDPLPIAGQILRDWAGIPLTVTNTYPDGQSFGYHRLMKATDWVASEEEKRQNLIAKYEQELLNYINGQGSELIEKLRQAGITGFGYESMCIHLDVRPVPFDPVYNAYSNHKDQYGDYTCFAFSCHWNTEGKIIIDVDKAI